MLKEELNPKYYRQYVIQVSSVKVLVMQNGSFHSIVLPWLLYYPVYIHVRAFRNAVGLDQIEILEISNMPYQHICVYMCTK